jgi:hydrogenase maturation protein HypF
LVGDAFGFERAAHLAQVSMPGGSAAITAPWRMAVAHLVSAFGELPDVPMFRGHEEQLAPVAALSASGASVATSSMGRLFDAIAALCEVADIVSYEGQAAIGLEQLAAGCDADVNGYDWAIDDATIIPTSSLIAAVFEDVRSGADRALIARRFHVSVAELVIDVCGRLRESTGLNVVALSGGVFQNRLLVELVVPRLTDDGFTELRHSQVPPNDGGISLGQVAIGRAHLDSIGG